MELKKLSTAIRGMQSRMDRGMDQSGPDDDKSSGGKRAFAFKGKCNICGKRGHMARGCPQRTRSEGTSAAGQMPREGRRQRTRSPTLA